MGSISNNTSDDPIVTGFMENEKELFSDFTVWFGSDDPCSISGKVDYVSQQAKGITLKLDLIVMSLKNQKTYVYNGERTFSRAVNIQDFYQ